MTIKPIMPFENEGFNGDTHAQQTVLDLVKHYGIHVAVETGTAFAGTTRFLARAGLRVYTVERSLEYHQEGIRRTMDEGLQGLVSFIRNRSEVAIKQMLHRAHLRAEAITPDGQDARPLVFLDAHWPPGFPLWDELALIESFYQEHRDRPKPVIIIHDCQNPKDPTMGFDDYGPGKAITPAAIAPYVERICGMEIRGLNEPRHSTLAVMATNNAATGARRGICYLLPTERGQAPTHLIQ